jgi:L-2,4-diaminobutyric acid acetyltransferase
VTALAPARYALADAVLREPTVADAAGIRRLVVCSRRLDVNSPYAYLVLCRDGRAVGFLTGYMRPAAPDTFFSWQSAVDSTVPVPGLAFAMMTTVVDRVRARGARFFETTINPDNRAVVMLIRKLARRYRATPEISVLFDERTLGPDHEPEVLYRFGLDG